MGTNGDEEATGRAGNRWSADQIIQALKEIVTGILAIALIWSTLSMARQTFQLIGQPEKISDAKDILLLMLGLAGEVIGYYFGRVPADARAVQAQEQAVSAAAKTEQVRAKAQQVAEEARRLTGRLVTGGVGTIRGPGGEDVTAEAERLQQAQEDLERLSRAR